LRARGIYTAVVCGEIEEVERILRDRPHLANARREATGRDRSAREGSSISSDLGGKNWGAATLPVLYAAALAKTNDNAAAIARLLLDFTAPIRTRTSMAGDSRYTPLVGSSAKAGKAARRIRAATRRRACYGTRRRAYDSQVIYNIHFHGKDPVVGEDDVRVFHEGGAAR